MGQQARKLRNQRQIGQEKTNKHKHFGRDGVRDKHEPSLGQMGPLPGTNWDPSLVGQTDLFLLKCHSKNAILSRLSLRWVGVRPWDDCPARAVRKMLMCLKVCWFFFRSQSFEGMPRECCRDIPDSWRCWIGIIEREVPQAYLRTRASSATLCSVRVSRVFLCIFYIRKGI